MDAKTWDDVRTRLEVENTFTTTMLHLRDIHGAGKLGPHVTSAISKKLAQMGVGHIPVSLSNSQHEQVRLFLHGTAVGTMISAVLTPGETNDQKLFAYVEDDGTNNAELIEQIREILS